MITDIQKLVNIIKQLRSPKGCPWDREQTHMSLIPHAIEEVYEVIDAIEAGHFGQELQEELGDLLLQVVLHAAIAEENQRFSLQQVIDQIASKLVRRHPHVFQEQREITEEEVGQQWEQIKANEKQGNQSTFTNIPKSAPALIAAQRIGDKAKKLGFDWNDFYGPLKKVDEELDEVKEAIQKNNSVHLEEEIGDLFFAVVNLTRHFKINAEEALRKANQKFKRRFKKVEEGIREAQQNNQTLTLEEMDRYWELAKQEEKM